MKQTLSNLLVSGKTVTIIKFAFILTILFTLVIFPSFALAGPIPGGAVGGY